MGEQKFFFSRSKAARIKTKADIVPCIDVTGSMKPCIEGVKNSLNQFVEGLQTAAEVDFRIRPIFFKDLHDPTYKGSPWTIGSFSSDINDFKRELASAVADGGGNNADGESGLDALYMAIHSDWRPDAHRTIIFMTDEDSHPTLHHTTYQRPDNGVDRVIQDFQTLRHAMLFMVCPNYPIYHKIEKSMCEADRKIVASYVPTEGDRHIGLRNVNFGPLFKMIGQQVSLTSVAMARAGKGCEHGMASSENFSSRQACR